MHVHSRESNKLIYQRNIKRNIAGMFSFLNYLNAMALTIEN
jgi:hypothetical protein